jgi:hypothetical protein
LIVYRFASGANGYLLTQKKGDKTMKRIKIFLWMFVTALLLTGCASTSGPTQEGGAVQCPACGYEFNAPSDA